MTKKEKNPILESQCKARGIELALIPEPQPDLMKLQYRIKRYQAMGNGAMCQDLTMQLQKLQKQGKM